MNKKNIKLIGISAIALLTIAGVGLVGLPLSEQSQKWAEETSQAKDLNLQKQSELDLLEKVKSQVSDIETINDELATRFPNLPKGTDLLQNISIAAAIAGISSGGVESIAITPPTLLVDTAAEAAEAEAAAAPIEEGVGEVPPEDGGVPTEGAEAPAADGETVDVVPASNVASMEISLSMKATQPQILSFTREFNNMSRTIKIKTATISAADEDGQSSFSLNGVAYLYASITPPVEPDESTPVEGESPTDVPADTPSEAPSEAPTG